MQNLNRKNNYTLCLPGTTGRSDGGSVGDGGLEGRDSLMAMAVAVTLPTMPPESRPLLALVPVSPQDSTAKNDTVEEDGDTNNKNNYTQSDSLFISVKSMDHRLPNF